jgi:hypothetical protein
MEEYIKWLENKIEVCLEDKDLQREHWTFCQALKKYRELALRQPLVSGRSEQFSCPLPDARCDRHKIDDEEGRWEFCNTCKREWAR